MSITLCNATAKALQAMRLKEQEELIDKLLIQGYKYYSPECAEIRRALYEKYEALINKEPQFHLPNLYITRIFYEAGTAQGEDICFFPEEGLMGDKKQRLISRLMEMIKLHNKEFDYFVYLKGLKDFLKKVEIVYSLN